MQWRLEWCFVYLMVSLSVVAFLCFHLEVQHSFLPCSTGWDVQMLPCVCCNTNYSLFIVITMALHSRYICKYNFVVIEKGGWSASAIGGQWVVPTSTAKVWLQKCHIDGQFGKCQGTGLWFMSSPAQDAAWVARAQKDSWQQCKQA